MSKLSLHIVSQEKKLVEVQADQVTAPSSQGEITVLPHHIPLFTELVLGELRYLAKGVEHTVVITKGFLTIDPNNVITVMVDSATLDRDISEQKAQAAIEAAKHTMSASTDRRELIMAEASLRQALLEIKVAQKTKKTTI